MSATKRTLTEVLDFENGEIINSDTFFNLTESDIFLTRKRLERAIQKIDEPKFICLYCKQLITIVGKPNGQGKKVKYFKHLKDSEVCIYKTNGNLTKSEVLRIKYNGAKESILHINLKNFIAQRLEENQYGKGEISEIKIEKIYRNLAISKEWKKPDVSAIFIQKPIVFELQLSTTFLSEIVKREDFYFKNNTYILWIFHHFNEKSDLQKFTQKDIIYSNKRNAFILSEEAQNKSIDVKDLVLECYYQVPSIFNKEIMYKWEKAFVTISDLKFDTTTYRLYYYDSDLEFKKLELKLKTILDEKDIAYESINYEERTLSALNLLRKFYQTEDFVLQFEINNELSLLSKAERQYLVNRINSPKNIEDKPLLFQLLGSDQKYTFLHFWLTNKYLSINVNKLWNGKSVLEEVLLGKRGSQKISLYKLIFEKGYNSYGKNDLNTIATFSSLSYENEIEGETLANITFLNAAELISPYLAIEKIVFAIRSCQNNKIVGSRLNNFLALSNNFLEHHSEYGDIYLQALKYYRRFNQVMALDKKGTFSKKLASYNASKPPQNDDFTNKKILNILFSDLEIMASE